MEALQQNADAELDAHNEAMGKWRLIQSTRENFEEDLYPPTDDIFTNGDQISLQELDRMNRANITYFPS